MKLDANLPILSADSPANLLDPIDIIHTMIDLRAQLAALEQQVQALQPAFYAACTALNLEKIATERATISRKLTPGKWAYPAEIMEQEDLLKQLKSQFQQAHEPIGGREIIWAIKLLLATA
ncbi:MAG: hypothetical protein H7Z11_06260 [Verrucomicrobia bacterium]|nr:hypothetical protein [Leptolyngbya sp. ES-bin-22]